MILLVGVSLSIRSDPTPNESLSSSFTLKEFGFFCVFLQVVDEDSAHNLYSVKNCPCPLPPFVHTHLAKSTVYFTLVGSDFASSLLLLHDGVIIAFPPPEQPSSK